METLNRGVTLEILSPAGRVVSEPYVDVALRPVDLNRKRIGLLWNGKKHGDQVLERVAESLARRFEDLDFVRLSSGAHLPWGAYPDEATIAELVRSQNCDAVIGAIGD